MKKIILILGISLTVIMAIGLNGCSSLFEDLDKVKDATITPTFRLPIAKSTFGLVEFLEKGDSVDYITTDPDGVIVFQFSEDISSEGVLDLIEIPDQNFNESVELSVPEINLLNTNRTLTLTELFDFTVETDEGDSFDSLLTTAGSLTISVLADFPADGEMTITFPGITENGVPVQDEFSWTFDGTQPSIDENRNIDFTELKIDFTNDGVEANDFKFEVELTLSNPQGTITEDNSLEINVDLIDLEIDALFGKIATRDISSDREEVKLDFFENVVNGNLILEEPSISLTFDNSFGIVAEANLENIVAFKNNESFPLTGSVIEEDFFIAAPSIDQIGESVRSELVIDKSNSNLPQLLNTLPDRIEYEFVGVLNPEGASEQNFVVQESDIEIDLGIEVPLIGRFRDLSVSDTVDFAGEDIVSDLQELLVRVNTTNEFPFNVDLQVFFVNQAGFVYDQLFPEGTQLIQSGIVGSDGEVTEATNSIVDVIIDEEKATSLENANGLLIFAAINSFNEGNTTVKVKDDQELTIKIGIEATLEVTLSGDE